MPPKGRRVGAALGEIRASGRVVLACRGCGERLLLLGQEDDWAGEGRLAFRCAGCGGEVGLAARVKEAASEEGGGRGPVRKLKPGDN